MGLLNFLLPARNKKLQTIFSCKPYKSDTVIVEGLKISFYISLMLFSILGNSSLIVIVTKNHRIQTITNYLIVNMAVSDILITLLAVPRKIYMLFTGFGSVRIVKNCDRGLENAARDRRPRAAFSSPRSQFFTIRTDPKPVNNLFIFFLL